MLKFFRRKSTLVKELKEQLRVSEEMIHALQNHMHKERQERVTVERALQECRERNTELQEALGGKHQVIRNLKDIIRKYHTQKQAMVQDLQSVKEAVLTLEQSTEKHRNHLEYELGLKEKNLQLERCLSIALEELEEQSLKHKNEAQTLKEAWEKSVEDTKKQTKKYWEEMQKNNQLQVTLNEKNLTNGNLAEKIRNLQGEVQTLKESCKLSEEAKLLSDNNSEEIRKAFQQKILTLEQSTEDQRKHLQHDLDMKEENSQQLERNLSIALLEEQSLKHKNEAQTLKEAWKKFAEDAKKQTEKTSEDAQRNQQVQVTLNEKDQTNGNLEEKIRNLQHEIQTLKESCKLSEEAKLLSDKNTEEIRKKYFQKLCSYAALENELDDARYLLGEKSMKLREKDLLIKNLKEEVEKAQEDAKKNHREKVLPEAQHKDPKSKEPVQNLQSRQIFTRRTRVVRNPHH